MFMSAFRKHPPQPRAKEKCEFLDRGGGPMGIKSK
jgi:hypothetical protein